MTLDDYLEAQVDEDAASAVGTDPAVALEVTEPAPPQLIANLRKLKRLGLMNGDTILSIVGQAPIDPLNLAATIMERQPTGWAFSMMDCSIVRVLARTEDKAVSAAARVDLLDNTVDTFVMNKAKQLTLLRRYEPQGDDVLSDIQKMCDEAVQAAAREMQQ